MKSAREARGLKLRGRWPVRQVWRVAPRALGALRFLREHSSPSFLRPVPFEADYTVMGGGSANNLLLISRMSD
jgi:hypothetical protein